jgi:hypothetical protein
MTDRLTLTRAFEGAGLKSGDAERIATEIYDAIHDNVATKADVASVESAVQLLRAEMREMEQRLDRRNDAMVTRLGALVVVVAGLLFAALHYWPAHG